jgi:excisionase family DNA binding protein
MDTGIPVRDPVELPRLLSVRELAAYLSVPPSTVYLWRSEGRGPKGFRVGKQVRYRAVDVEEWLREQAARAGVT